MVKRIAVILLTGLFSAGVISAQSHAADSLKTLLGAHPAEDTTRVNTLIELAREIRRSKPAVVDSLVTVIEQLSDKLDFDRGRGLGRTIRGNRLYDVSDFHAADSVFKAALQWLEKSGDRAAQAYLFRCRANLEMDEGSYAQSLESFLKGLKLAEEAGDIRQAVDINRTVGYLYNVIGDLDKAIPYQEEALKKAKSINYLIGISGAYNAIGKTYKTAGNYPASLDAYTKGLEIDRIASDTANILIDYSNIGDVYERMGNYQQAFAHLWPALNYYKNLKGSTMVPWDEWAIGKAYTHSGRPDSGLYYARHSYELSRQLGWKLYLKEITYLIAESAAKLHQWDTAYKYLSLHMAYKDSLTGQEIARKTTMLQASYELDKKQAEIALLTKDRQLQAAENRRERNFLYGLGAGLFMLITLAVILIRNNRNKQKANILLKQQKAEIDMKANELTVQKDNLEQSYKNVELLGDIGQKITSSLSIEKIIGTVYDSVNQLMDATVFGIGIYNDEQKQLEFPATYENGVALPFYSNSIYDQNRFAGICYLSGKEIVMGDLSTQYQQYIQTLPTTQQGDQPVSLIYLPLHGKEHTMGVITVQSFQKDAYSDYHLYMLRNIANYTSIALENADSYKKLNQTVDRLKLAQAQLVQAEKMASLGELTAGIAHEIQNPLNFVNNFSEVSNELLNEMNEELQNGNYADAIALSADIRLNLDKILHHGRRADAIVKGMLQHSRSSSGVKETTDINALCDEYLRLSYHGLRARDKSFNAQFTTDFDPAIGPIQVIPQDLGRVVLNLINNAFYAVTARRKLQESGYEPTVTVRTRKHDKGVEITVQDNGTGIPEKVLAKIFQPFFTTKPTGEGTGLGLSLSYDIVTKAHGGALNVETKEGQGTSFIITIPQ